jgi:hypothetical protein
MVWELYQRKSGWYSGGGPTACVRSCGEVALSAEAAAQLGEAVTHVHLLYDEDRTLLGIRATEKPDVNAYALRRESKSGICTVRAESLLKKYGIRISRAQRVQPTMEGAILVIPVNPL